MDLENKRYIIGIDLGTTNSAVSYVELTSGPAVAKESGAGPRLSKKSRINVFKVPQLTGPGEIGPLPVLPSFLYIPGTYDISEEAISIPWNMESKNFAGVFARDHGVKVPARLVSSAKSWLCHGNVDRKAKILPWGSGEEIVKVSPVQATSAYLSHIKHAWNFTRGNDESARFENQMIIITVPASFDEVARDLTAEAAAMAGLKEITLLEEPLAAFYSWLISNEQEWNKHVKEDELILVCDVGGGTTDFTLITLKKIDGQLRFERIAVGDHLILGGDNIDLALARHIETGFGKNRPALSSDRWKTLCHQCRQAKENILGGKADAEKITLMGSGSKLIAGTLSATLHREELENIVLEGFFPIVESGISPEISARKGITEFGLPYEQEPAITKHLGWFLEKHKKDVLKLLNKAPMLDLILFNGGSLKPWIIQERIGAAIRHWFKPENKTLPRVLKNPDPDLAVALGASYYGLVKTGEGVRVGSGSARGYYLGISRKDSAGEISETKANAICLVERGLEEGSLIELMGKKFEVLANQRVSFDVYSSSFRSGDRSGDLVEIDSSLTPLPPIQTIIQFGKKEVKTAIPVNIQAEFSEMGILSLWCRSLSSHHRWRLQFQLREVAAQANIENDEVFEETIVETARQAIAGAFSQKAGTPLLENLSKTISDIIQRPKGKWPLSIIRSLSDELLQRIDARQTSAGHEIRWLNLTGYCLRPGFGDGFDPHRMAKLWKIYKPGPCFPKNPQAASEWWIMWRRVAGGLNPGQQKQFIQDLSSVISPKKDLKKKIPPQELLEIWMAVANMERLSVKDKIKWGEYFLSEIKPGKCKKQQLWALSRIGARELLYGTADKVVPSDQVSSWIERLLSFNWSDASKVADAISHMARKTGDRVRNVTPVVTHQIIDWMSKNGIDSHDRVLKEVVPLEKQEESAIFGEDLPAGLVLHV